MQKKVGGEGEAVCSCTKNLSICMNEKKLGGGGGTVGEGVWVDEVIVKMQIKHARVHVS